MSRRCADEAIAEEERRGLAGGFGLVDIARDAEECGAGLVGVGDRREFVVGIEHFAEGRDAGLDLGVSPPREEGVDGEVVEADEAGGVEFACEVCDGQ